MRNLELKVRCMDEAALQALEQWVREAGAVYQRCMRQRDTYFHAPHGRLKLREWELIDDEAGLQAGAARFVGALGYETDSAGAELVAYTRPDHAGSRLSDYFLSPVADATTLKIALTHVLGVRVVVAKSRLLYLYAHTRIHLDRVEGLGAFVELETVFDDTMTVSEVQSEHSWVATMLKLSNLPVIAHSYSDLLEGLTD